MANIRKVTGHTANPWNASIADFFSNKNWERQLGDIDPRSGEPTSVGNWYRPANNVGSVGDIQNNVTLRKGPFPYEPMTVPRVVVEPAVEVGKATPSLPGMNEFEGYKAATADPIPTEKEGMIGQFVDALSGAGEAGWDFYKSSVHDPAFDFGLNNGQSIVDSISKGNKKGEGLASNMYNDIYGWAAKGGVQNFLKQYDEGFRGIQDNVENLAAKGGLNPAINAFGQLQDGIESGSSEMYRLIEEWAAKGGVQKLGTQARLKAIDVIKFLRKAGVF